MKDVPPEPARQLRMVPHQLTSLARVRIEHVVQCRYTIPSSRSALGHYDRESNSTGSRVELRRHPSPTF